MNHLHWVNEAYKAINRQMTIARKHFAKRIEFKMRMEALGKLEESDQETESFDDWMEINNDECIEELGLILGKRDIAWLKDLFDGE